MPEKKLSVIYTLFFISLLKAVFRALNNVRQLKNLFQNYVLGKVQIIQKNMGGGHQVFFIKLCFLHKFVKKLYIFGNIVCNFLDYSDFVIQNSFQGQNLNKIWGIVFWTVGKHAKIQYTHVKNLRKCPKYCKTTLMTN